MLIFIILSNEPVNTLKQNILFEELLNNQPDFEGRNNESANKKK